MNALTFTLSLALAATTNLKNFYTIDTDSGAGDERANGVESRRYHVVNGLVDGAAALVYSRESGDGSSSFQFEDTQRHQQLQHGRRRQQQQQQQQRQHTVNKYRTPPPPYGHTTRWWHPLVADELPNPTNVRAQALTNDTALVMWTPVDDQKVIGYRVHYTTEASRNSWESRDVMGRGSNRSRLVGLIPRKMYSLCVSSFGHQVRS